MQQKQKLVEKFNTAKNKKQYPVYEQLISPTQKDFRKQKKAIKRNNGQNSQYCSTWRTWDTRYRTDSNATINKQAETPDSLTCQICKQVFVKEDAKVLSCDRCEQWFCTKCANISDAGYNFLASQEAENTAWYCKPCKQPAKAAVVEDKSIENKCKEYTEKLSQNLKMIEEKIQRKAEISTIEELQKRVEELE